MLRKMMKSDVPAVVNLHTNYMPGALFPKLGDKFLTALYNSMINLDCAANYVWEDKEEKRAVAFITAAEDSSILFRKVLWKNFPVFLLSALSYMFKDLHHIQEVIETLRYSKLADIENITAELLFIAIEKPFRKQEISDALVLECIEWAKQKGHQGIKVTTYESNRGANTLLARLGFALTKQLPFRGSKINLYTYNFHD